MRPFGRYMLICQTITLGNAIAYNIRGAWWSVLGLLLVVVGFWLLLTDVRDAHNYRTVRRAMGIE